LRDPSQLKTPPEKAGFLYAVGLPNKKLRKHNLESDRQIKTISDFCGFQNPNSLRKFFKRETGMTLSEWKKKNR
jgi:methylphosphotriester-DNA--protein-cysteine methyltransferase